MAQSKLKSNYFHAPLRMSSWPHRRVRCSKDDEVVLAAVQDNGSALRFAGAGPRANRQVVLEAMRLCGTALHCAADRGGRREGGRATPLLGIRMPHRSGRADKCSILRLHYVEG